MDYSIVYCPGRNGWRLTDGVKKCEDRARNIRRSSQSGLKSPTIIFHITRQQQRVDRCQSLAPHHTILFDVVWQDEAPLARKQHGRL